MSHLFLGINAIQLKFAKVTSQIFLIKRKLMNDNLINEI